MTAARDKPQPPRRLKLWRRDPRCFWCGRVTVFETTGRVDSATLEHVYPRRADAARHLPLTVLSCYPCNHERGAPAPTTAEACPVLKLITDAIEESG